MDIEEFREITKDKTLHCTDCDKDYIFPVGEQKYFFTKGLATPKRCPDCREIRKATIKK